MRWQAGYRWGGAAAGAAAAVDAHPLADIAGDAQVCLSIRRAIVCGCGRRATAELRCLCGTAAVLLAHEGAIGGTCGNWQCEQAAAAVFTVGQIGKLQLAELAQASADAAC